MNKTSLLVLSLVTFTLSNVSAAYAKDNNADVNTTDVNIADHVPNDSILQFGSTSNTTSSWSDFPQPTSKNGNTDRLENAKPPSDSSFAVPPVFDPPSFQSNSQAATLEVDQPSSSKVDASSEDTSEFKAPGLDASGQNTKVDTYQSNTPEISPFQLPEGLTDSDLFESDDEPNKSNDSEIDTSPSDSVSSNSITHSVPSPEPSLTFERVLESDLVPTLQEAPNSIARSSPSSSSQASFNETSAAVSTSATRSIGLDFALKPAKPSSINAADPVPPEPAVSAPPVEQPVAAPEIAKSITEGSLDALFVGDSNSLVARTVGSAEGTRSIDGSKNPAYYGHTDPGNGVWNLGSFSYQHGASSPEEADAKQLARLRQQAKTMMEKASAKGMSLTLEEKLNGIDLANQAPKAVLDKQGYIDWLAEAHSKGMSGADAILWARVQSFIDPYTQTWNAPGLGNTEESISHDQNRRMLAIAKALTTYLQEVANSSPTNQAANNQVSDRSLSEEEGIARLLAQPMTRLFDWAGSLASDVSDSDSIAVQRLFALDL